MSTTVSRAVFSPLALCLTSITIKLAVSHDATNIGKNVYKNNPFFIPEAPNKK